ncbi:BRO family protein [Sphaerisporangium sp. TRM90804]|uniref:BRO family protein n=1 Tax=Sphaerisporangium sp. TRM90804 TaxID=3031113 RepID=UPI002449CAE1|nr:BRO family protein [Sphaerisporangium sp. TRM90804]MDH2424770.1 phage antirepressor KilAC domain-containing protein [Sphaerisporangium sp. TRM90804]
MTDLIATGSLGDVAGADSGVMHYPETGQALRWVKLDGVLWMHFGDVCKGAGHKNPSAAIHLVEDEDKRKINMRSLSAGQTALSGLRAAITGNAETWFVNEDGFATVGLAGRGDGPRMFRQWVVKVVLKAFKRAHEMTIPKTYPEALELAAKQAREIEAQNARIAEQQRVLAINMPKADFVDTFVDPAKDTTLFRTFCGQINAPERLLREHLKAKGIIYRKLAGRRWSKSKKAWEDVHQYYAHAPYKTWFHPVDQVDAPRLHNGQLQTTLYVTPVGKVGIKKWLERNPIEGAA